MTPQAEQALCDVGAALEVRRERQGLTVAQWAQRSRLTKTGIRGFRLLRSDPKLSTLTRAADALGCDIRIVLVERRPE